MPEILILIVKLAVFTKLLIRSTYIPEEQIKEFVKSFALPNYAAVLGKVDGSVDFTTVFPFMEPSDNIYSMQQYLTLVPGLHAQLLSIAVRKAGEDLERFIT